jgi:hypothetical protein
MRQRWWLVAAVFVTCMGMTVLPAGAQLPVPAPSVPTPTVPTPSVPTPTVPTPTVPVPTVPTPTVPTPPPVPVPAPAPAPSAPVRVPSVTVPSVRTPSVSTPAGTVQSTSTPSVSTPSVSTPKVAAPGSAPTRSGAGSTGAGSTGSGSPGSGSGSAGSGGGSGGGATGTAGSTSGSATSPGSSATGADGQSTRGGSSDAKPKTRAARIQQRERNLRSTVLRFRGCLSRVPRSERRVLSLRAGVGRLRAHTRSEVARITHLRRARVIKLERRGLRRLRALNRAGACQDAGAATTAMTVAPGTGTGTPAPPAGTPGDRTAVLAEHHSGANQDSGSQGKPERAELSISRPSTSGPGGSSFDLALVLGPLAFLAFLLVITREVRRAG